LEVLLHRSNQVENVEKCLKSYQNVFLCGSSGTGKTLTIKYILENIDIDSVYINCWEYNSRSAVLSKILVEQGIVVPRKGVPTDYMYEKLENLVKSKKGLIVVLDQIDHLQEKSHLLYDLLKLKQDHKLVIVAITNKRDVMQNLDQRVQSRFLPVTIEFPPYTAVELLDILRDSFKKMDDGILAVVSREASQKGDCRFAFEVLIRANRYSSQERIRIKMEHVLKVLDELPIT